MQDGISDPPSTAAINKIVRGGNKSDQDPEGKKNHTIDGILKSKFKVIQTKILDLIMIQIKVEFLTIIILPSFISKFQNGSIFKTLC